MKIIIASDSFKGSLSSIEIGQIITAAAKDLNTANETITVPIADGGEGTIDAFLNILSGKKIQMEIVHPTKEGETLSSYYAKCDDTSIIEVAQAVGLPLVDDCKQPITATSYGVGQLMKHALLGGCKKMIIGLGGSCTTDGGIGMAAALGFLFLDKNGDTVPLNGEGLSKIKTIVTSEVLPALFDTEIIFACDVKNPLYGKLGAAYVFSGQKGADIYQQAILDAGLQAFGEVVFAHTDKDMQEITGSGAAGGMAVIPLAFAGATMRQGMDIIMELSNFSNLICDADLIFTGEGRIDSQSMYGKVPLAVAEIAAAQGKPVVAVVGQAEYQIDLAYEQGLTAVFPISRKPKSIEECIAQSAEDLYYTAKDILRLFTKAKGLEKEGQV